MGWSLRGRAEIEETEGLQIPTLVSGRGEGSQWGPCAPGWGALGLCPRSSSSCTQPHQVQVPATVRPPLLLRLSGSSEHLPRGRSRRAGLCSMASIPMSRNIAWHKVAA